MPYGIGALFVNDGTALARAHAGSADYVQDVTAGGSLGFADLSPELSRAFRGLRVWLPLQLHGLRAFREQLAPPPEPLKLVLWDLLELLPDDDSRGPPEGVRPGEAAGPSGYAGEAGAIPAEARPVP